MATTFSFAEDLNRNTANQTTPNATASATTPATETPAAATVTSSRTTSSQYTPTGMYDPANLQAYNAQREAQIRQMYSDAQNSTLAGLKTAYDQNLSDANAARDQISPQYQRSMNSLSAEYERQRRNNNMQAAANGLNTGAGSQMQLAQSANYQANQAGLAAKENEALNEANRRIGDLQRNYQNAIAEATANNNYKLAASLLEEYQNAYNRQLNIENTNYTRAWNEDERNYSRGVDEANRKAQYGDFSGYADMYGEDTANIMEKTWALQNPYQAWAAGKLSAADFYAITGKLPADPNSVASQLPNGGETYTGLNPEAATSSPTSIGGTHVYGGRSRSSGSGGLFASLTGSSSGSSRSYSRGGYSASRDTAYRGAPGYLNTNGEFVTGWSNDSPYSGHEKDYAVAQAYADAYSQSKNKYASNLYARDNYQDYMPNGTSSKATVSGTGSGTVDRKGLK